MDEDLKFRIWNEETKTFETGEMNPQKTSQLLKDIVVLNKPLVFEQCTGFKDCEGQLMHVGDIIKVNLDEDDSGIPVNGNFVIVNDSGHLATINASSYLDYVNNKNIDSVDVITMEHTYKNDPEVRVIGNIHENKDLID